MKKKITVILSMVLMLYSMTACGRKNDKKTTAEDMTIVGGVEEDATATDGDTLQKSDELIVAISEEPTSGFDPAIKWPYSGNPIFQSMLFKYDRNGNVVEDLAIDWSVNEENTVFEVDIRDDAICSDGVQISAEDVAFSYNIIPETCTWVDYSSIDSVEAVDEDTVKFTLKYSNIEFFHIMAMTAIIPEHAYDSETYFDNPIGSGPYVLKEWAKGEKMVVEANPYYYGDVATNKITFLFANTDTALALAKTGEVDVARVSVNLADNQIDGYSKQVHNTNDGMSIFMPSIPETEINGNIVGNNVTCDVAIRRAVSYAIDRQEMVDGILGGYGEAYYDCFEGTEYENIEGKFEDNNKEKAIQILEEAGWVDSDGDGIREKDGIKASFTLCSVPQDQTYSPRQGICLAVQQTLAEIGIEIDIVYKQYSELKEEGLIWSQAYLQGCGGNNALDVYTQFSSSMIRTSTYNPTSYSNEVVDSYLEQAMQSDTLEEANKYLSLVQWDGTTGTNILGDCVWIPVIKVQHVYYVKNGVNLNFAELREAPHRGGTWTVTETITSWTKE